MKTLIALVMCVVLTGCSGTPSLSDSAKLLEYEKCLSAEEQQFILAAQRASDVNLDKFFKEQKLEGPLVENFIEACEKFHPK